MMGYVYFNICSFKFNHVKIYLQVGSKDSLVTLERKGETKTITLPKKFSQLIKAANEHFSVEVLLFSYKHLYIYI